MCTGIKQDRKKATAAVHGLFGQFNVMPGTIVSAHFRSEQLLES